MKRGLKDKFLTRTQKGFVVEETSPMKRGLKELGGRLLTPERRS